MQDRDGHQYALKRVLAQDRDTVAIIQREIDVMQALNPHPHIVSLLGAVHRETAAADSQHRRVEYFILMELCSKGTLASFVEARRIRRVQFPEKEVLRLFTPVVRAVAHMHAQSPPIVHRDLKPENVLINAAGEFRVCDFGSSTTTNKIYASPVELADLEEQVQKFTTAAYRAPEQVDISNARWNKWPVGPAVDVWALGGILCTCCVSLLCVVCVRSEIPEVSPGADHCH